MVSPRLWSPARPARLRLRLAVPGCDRPLGRGSQGHRIKTASHSWQSVALARGASHPNAGRSPSQLREREETPTRGPPQDCSGQGCSGLTCASLPAAFQDWASGEDSAARNAAPAPPDREKPPPGALSPCARALGVPGGPCASFHTCRSGASAFSLGGPRSCPARPHPPLRLLAEPDGPPHPAALSHCLGSLCPPDGGFPEERNGDPST